MTISKWPLTTVVRRNVSSTSKCPSVTPNVFSYRPSYIFRKRERSQSLHLIFDFENSAKSLISEPFILNFKHISSIEIQIDIGFTTYFLLILRISTLHTCIKQFNDWTAWCKMLESNRFLPAYPGGFQISMHIFFT